MYKHYYDGFVYLLLDLNECSNNNGGCDHNCTDTEGSYECSCEMGHILREDQHSCQGYSRDDTINNLK